MILVCVFAGVEVKPGKPFTLKSTTNDAKRLHLSQATLGLTSTGTNRSILQCNVGNKSPLFLCVLSPEKVDSCQLNIEFQESEDVIFSVIGPRSVHLTGYFLGRNNSPAGLGLNDDESESFGEDIVDTDVEKGSSDDYDYSDSFINDDDDRPSSTDDDELTVKERVAKTKAKKRNKRLRKKFQVSDSDSDETSSVRADDSVNEDDSVEILNSDNDHKTPKVLSSEVPLPSRVTRSKAKCSTLENGEKTSEATTTHTHKAKDKKKDKPSGDVDELSPVKKGSEVLSKKDKKRNKEPVVINTDEEEEKDTPETQKKPDTDKAIESSTDVTLSKKKRKKERREEIRERKKQATEKNMEKEASTKKPELSPNEVTVEEIKKGKSDGKVAVQGKKVSILYTGKLKDTGKVFESNLEESPLRFRLGGEEVIKGLSNGVEGMRAGDKRRLIIPPSLGYSKEELKKKDVPKNSWLVYEVEAVKVR